MLIWLAATTPPVSPGTHIPKPDTVSPGFAGFLTIFLLAIATIILIRSMVKHMRKVRYSPDPAAPAPASASASAPPPAPIRTEEKKQTPAG